MKLNWSRRELEAFGEPLGDSVTMPKLGGGWICGGGGGKGGGGGGPQQVTSTTTTSNIPEYAKPYVENMLQSAQAQIYSDDMTTFRPYQPYSTDVSNYFAPFSPMQQQAQQAAYYMTTPGQYDIGTALAGTAGAEALGTPSTAAGLGQEALGYGALGSQYGGLGSAQAQQAALQAQAQAGLYGGMGARYGRQAAGLAPTAQAYGQEAADIGMGGLGYGALGAGYGARGAEAAEQGFGAGEQYARQATDPYAVQAYMSPYMQNVVDYQKMQALRDYNIGQGLRKAQAVGAGAFGGSRQAIAESEAERALQSQLQGIAATGSQQAFQQAQQAQQFGANLGLQGLQAGYGGLGLGMQGVGQGLAGLGTALQGQQARMAGLGQAGQFLGQGMQGAGVGLQGVGQQLGAGQLGLQGTAQGIQGAQTGLQGVGQAVGAGQYGLAGLGAATQAAGTLGQLGTQQQAATQNILNLQSTLGAQQQALEQQKINQAVQDYATAQQYPFMQLGMLNAMLRGLPMQSMTTQAYQASPSYLTQGLGALGTLGGAYKAFGAEGGQVKGLKAGGAIKGFYEGDVVGSIRAKLQTMDKAQLQNVIKTSKSDEVREMAAQILNEKLMAEQTEKRLPPTAPMQLPEENMGIAALPAPAMDQMAGGGIVAFSGEDESLVNEDEMVPYVTQAQKARAAAGVTGEPYEAYKEFLGKQVSGLPQMKEQEKGLMMMDYFSRLGTTPGSLLYAGLTAAKETAPAMKASLDKVRKAEADVMKGQADLVQAERLEKLGLAKDAAALRKDDLDRKKALEVAKINANATMANINRPDLTDKSTQIFLEEMISKLPPEQREAARKDPALLAEARRKALEMGPGMPGRKTEIAEETAADKAIKESPAIKQMRREQAQYEPGSPEHADLQQKIKAEEQRIRERYKSTPGAAPASTPTSGQNIIIQPLPADQSKLEKGSYYKTARGTAKWNGTAFELVPQQ